MVHQNDQPLPPHVFPDQAHEVKQAGVVQQPYGEVYDTRAIPRLCPIDHCFSSCVDWSSSRFRVRHTSPTHKRGGWADAVCPLACASGLFAEYPKTNSQTTLMPRPIIRLAL